MFILFKITRFKRKKFWGRTPEPPPPYNCNITKTLNNAKPINSNIFWRVENSGKRSYLWKDIALKAVTMAKLDFDHTYAEYTLKRPPSSFVFCLSNFSRRLDPLWRKFLDPRLKCDMIPEHINLPKVSKSARFCHGTNLMKIFLENDTPPPTHTHTPHTHRLLESIVLYSIINTINHTLKFNDYTI